MFFEAREKQGASRHIQPGAVAGYDLGAQTAQISYFLPGAEKPETISQVAGEEEYLIPAVLARMEKKELWLYGKEALEAAQKGEAQLVEDLLARAVEGRPILLQEESYDPVVLLSLFVKRSLSLLTPIIDPDKLKAFVFTVEEVTKPVIDVLTAAVSLLSLKAGQIYVIGRAESFFYYNISQPKELWRQEVAVCDFSGSFLKTLLFSVNKNTQPIASFVDEARFEQILPIAPGADEVTERRSGMLLDRQFLQAVTGLLEGRQVSTVYLIGQGFTGSWYQESLSFLCDGRRVFLGNNLYSKGACYAARERLDPGGISRGYAFLGKDMLRSNVGMHVVRRGVDAYFALLDAGVNWYEAKRECDFLLENENSFSMRITPVNGKEIKEVLVTLTGLPIRHGKTTRIHLQIEMLDAETVRITMEDRGFGEFFPATHKLWEETFVLG